MRRRHRTPRLRGRLSGLLSMHWPREVPLGPREQRMFGALSRHAALLLDNVTLVEKLRGSLAGMTAEQIARVVIAYEPVWAIGTGRVASASDAQEVCAAVRATLRELAGDDVAGSVRVLYGGSVNAKNVGEIVGQPDIDGALVGGASLKSDEFATLSAIAAGGPLP